MLFAVQHLAQLLAGRVRERLAAVETARPQDVIDAILMEALPTDRQSRVFHFVYPSYGMLSVTDPALTGQPFMAASNAMERYLAGQLRAAREAGDLPPDVDPEQEAAALLAMSAGLGTSVLLGQRSADQAAAVLRHQLRRDGLAKAE